MLTNLYDYQKEAVENLKTGSILCGGVGSGKSRTAIAYYYYKECKGTATAIKVKKDIYIITTAKKRDSLEWEKESAPFAISTKRDCSIGEVKLTVDSWNNIGKYINVKNSFFIFDEQRLVGSGAWVKSFLKIVKHNNWILLSATPGDTWSDYIPVFIANGFYKNRTEFLRRHAVYSRFSKFPLIEKYIETKHLEKLRDSITVLMHYKKHTSSVNEKVIVPFNKKDYDKVITKRWNIYTDKPIKTISETCYLLRKIVNSDKERIEALKRIFKKHSKLIIFYNFDYELEMLREYAETNKIPYSEWNGHKHQSIPKNKSWLYLVQYTSGAEGWNCIETDTIVFFSQNYSYKIMVQSAGRIDRLNSPFNKLYYYTIMSNSKIDLAIAETLKKKKSFNAYRFMNQK